VEGQAVVAAAAGRAVRLHTADHLVAGQLARRHLLGVVDAADDEGAVRVALQEIEDDLLADPRDLDEAPALARPGGADANPAGAVLVLPPLAVPVDLHLDPAILVGVNPLARRPNHHRRLRPLDHRLVGPPGGAADDRVGDAGEAVAVLL